MKRMYCEQEARLVQALSSGSLSSALEKHAAECPICGEVMLVTELLRSGMEESPPQLPDAGLVWWKAQLASRRAAMQRATVALGIVRLLAYSAAVAVVAWTLFEALRLSSLNSTLAQYAAAFSRGLSGSAMTLSVLGAGMAVLTTLLGSLYILWSDS